MANETKRYLLAFGENPITGGLTHIMGSDGTWHSKVLRRHELEKQGQTMKAMKKAVKEVYALHPADYTQKMCEMTGQDFYEAVKQKGIKIA